MLAVTHCLLHNTWMCRQIVKTMGTTHRKTQRGDSKSSIFSAESGLSHFIHLTAFKKTELNWLLERAVRWVFSLPPNPFVDLLIYKCESIWRWNHWEMSTSWNVAIMNETGACSNYQGSFILLALQNVGRWPCIWI